MTSLLSFVRPRDVEFLAYRGEIRVRVERKGEDLLVSVTNSGPVAGEIREGIGLSSTRTRLERLYPGKFDFSYRRLEKGGMEVAIRIAD